MDATTAVDERGSAGGFNAAALAGKYLTFSLGSEEYGLPVPGAVSAVYRR